MQSVEGAVEWEESEGGVLKVLAVEQLPCHLVSMVTQLQTFPVRG